MAKISLRAYIREIENLIDRGDLQAAQANCKHILNIFPKYIDAYRLLGKSYIEAKQFSEAEDIFQRVLASIPDDFISHICMSMVREESENLDAAIWHMERAYEMQPSYLDVMNEIKRLYGKRDGVEPPKVKLTRGALVRMYTRTKLYPQAIAECRTALSEEPGRVDLEVLLASLYFQSSQKVEATELCSKILSSAPYCYEANRILSEILPSTTRSDEANTLKNRIIELNPYCAHLSQNITSPDLVPETAILIEHWDPGSQSTENSSEGQSKDIPSLGDQTPDWMKPFAQPKDDAVTVASENHEVNNEQQNAESIPDWMKAAGWSESSNTREDPPSVVNEGVSDATADVLPADIPDWLKDIEPSKNTQEDGLENTPAVSPFENVNSDGISSKIESQIPEWLSFDESESNKPSNPTKVLSEEITSGDHHQQDLSEPSNPVAPTTDNNVPDWLKELKPDNEPITREIPDSSELTEEINNDQNQALKGTIPTDWIEESTSTPSTGRTAPLLPDEELPGWLKEIEITPEGSEELNLKTESSPATPKNDIPDWLRDLSDSETQTPIQKNDAELHTSESIGSVSENDEQKSDFIDISKENTSLDTWLTSLGDSSDTDENLSVVQDTQEKLNETKTSQDDVINTNEAINVKSSLDNINTNIGQNQEYPAKSIDQFQKIEEKYFDSYQKIKDYLAKEDHINLGKEIGKLLRSNKLVDELLAEIQTYAQKYPEKPIVWQLIGDIYSKKNMLQLAFGAYNKAEQLLR